MNPAVREATRALGGLLENEPLNRSRAEAVARVCRGERARVVRTDEVALGWLIEIGDAHLSDASTGKPLLGGPPLFVTREGGVYEIAGPPAPFERYSDWIEEFGVDALATLDDANEPDPELERVWNAIVAKNVQSMLNEYERDVRRFALVPIHEPMATLHRRRGAFMSPSDPLAPAHIRAHAHCGDHRAEILKSVLCGCFHCLAKFEPAAILEWTDLRNGVERTALCPECGIDSVLGDASGFPIEEAFLAQMRDHWFHTG